MKREFLQNLHCPLSRRLPTHRGLSWDDIVTRTSHHLFDDSKFLLVLLGAFPDHLDIVALSSSKFARNVATKLGGQVEDGLKYFAGQVRDDPETALMFCKANKKSYPHVSFRLRNQAVGLATEVLLMEPTFLFSSVPSVERQLLSDKKFVFSVFKAIRKRYLQFPSGLYDALAPAMRSDEDITLAAARAGAVSVEQLSSDCYVKLLRRKKSSLRQLTSNNSITLLKWLHQQPVKFVCDSAWWQQKISKDPRLWSYCLFLIDDADFVKKPIFKYAEGHSKDISNVH